MFTWDSIHILLFSCVRPHAELQDAYRTALVGPGMPQDCHPATLIIFLDRILTGQRVQDRYKRLVELYVHRSDLLDLARAHLIHTRTYFSSGLPTLVVVLLISHSSTLMSTPLSERKQLFVVREDRSSCNWRSCTDKERVCIRGSDRSNGQYIRFDGLFERLEDRKTMPCHFCDLPFPLCILVHSVLLKSCLRGAATQFHISHLVPRRGCTQGTRKSRVA